MNEDLERLWRSTETDEPALGKECLVRWKEEKENVFEYDTIFEIDYMLICADSYQTYWANNLDSPPTHFIQLEV